MRDGGDGGGRTRDNVDSFTALVTALSGLDGTAVNHEGGAVNSAHCLS